MASNDLITKEEMSALLEAPAGGGSAAAGDKRQRVVPYNFRRPDRVSKEQVRSLYLMHDMFSHNLSSSLLVLLRNVSEASLISVEQQAYVEYLYGLPDPTVIYTLSMQPLQGVMVLELNPSLAFCVIDRLLGGPGQPLTEPRAVSDLEQKILESFVNTVADDLREAWKPIVELELEIAGRETRPQMLQIVAPNEVVLSIVFHVQVGDARGMMSFCIPAVTLEPIIQKFNQSFYTRNREVPPEQTRALLDSLLPVTFPVAAEIRGTTVAMDDLMQIVPGDVIRLDHLVENSVDVTVGGLVKFKGDLMAYRGRTTVHISSSANRDGQGKKKKNVRPAEQTTLQPVDSK